MSSSKMQEIKKNSGGLGSEEQGNAHGEFPVAGFAPDQIHACQCAEAAAQGCGGHQRCFGDAPQAVFGLIFVEEHKCEGRCIDNKEIEKEKLHDSGHLSGGMVMKKVLAGICAAVLLAGCAPQQPEFETMGTEPVSQHSRAAAGEIGVWLPEEAGEAVMAGAEKTYSWEGCEVRVRTLDGGDIRRTIEQLTGMKYENLTVMSRQKGDLKLYQTVWCSAGEDATILGRAVVADDGNYHYCVSLTAPESVDVSGIYDRMVRSLAVVETDSKK